MMSPKTVGSLTGLIQSHLLPLLKASSCFYASADSDVFRPQIIDAVGIPHSAFNTIQAYFRGCPLARQMVDRNSLVETYDLDIPRRELQDSVEKFFEAHPASRLRGSSYLEDIRTILLTIDRFEPAIVIEFHRVNANREPFTRRENRILELLSPHLFQAMKALVLKEGLINQTSAAEKGPLGSQNPTVQVTGESKIVDQNPKFGKLFNSLPGDNLDASLTRLLERGIKEHEVSFDAPTPEAHASWYCLCPRVYQIDITRRPNDLWLLELHPLNEVCPGFNPGLKHYGLTPKEKEVCCRVRQGCGNQEIASQLFISFHTAKTHLKNIYRKLDIPNRPRLVSFLNKK
jgi:DNA-binding CsgD family transcriptional regulator